MENFIDTRAEDEKSRRQAYLKWQNLAAEQAGNIQRGGMNPFTGYSPWLGLQMWGQEVFKLNPAERALHPSVDLSQGVPAIDRRESLWQKMKQDAQDYYNKR